MPEMIASVGSHRVSPGRAACHAGLAGRPAATQSSPRRATSEAPGSSRSQRRDCGFRPSGAAAELVPDPDLLPSPARATAAARAFAAGNGFLPGLIVDRLA
jgi:hypothetical protein